MKVYRNIAVAVIVVFAVALAGMLLNPDMAPDFLNYKLEPNESNTVGTVYAIAVFAIAMTVLVLWNVKNIISKFIEIFKNNKKDVK